MSRPAPAPPTFDPAAAHPEVEQLRGLVRARDWAAIEDFIARLPGEPERAFLTGMVDDVAGSEEFLAECVRAESWPGLAHTLLAARYIKLGWEIRTELRARYVSREQFAALHEYLRKAERLLIDATAARPDNVAAWCGRITTAKGLELGQSEARRRYDRLARTDPHNFRAQRRMVQQMCPKWSGSWDTMFAFARDCAWSAPPGSVNPAVLVEAHTERYLDLGDDDGRRYLARDDVRQEIFQAAERSVGHPDFRRCYGWVDAHNLFAFIFSVMGHHRLAANSFRAVGHLATSYPWRSYEGDQSAAFRRLRDTALAKG